MPFQPFCDYFSENYLHRTIYRSLLKLQSSTIGKKIEFLVDMRQCSNTFTDFLTALQQVKLPTVMRKPIKLAVLKYWQLFFNQQCHFALIFS